MACTCILVVIAGSIVRLMGQEMILIVRDRSMPSVDDDDRCVEKEKGLFGVAAGGRNIRPPHRLHNTGSMTVFHRGFVQPCFSLPRVTNDDCPHGSSDGLGWGAPVHAIFIVETRWDALCIFPYECI